MSTPTPARANEVPFDAPVAYAVLYLPGQRAGSVSLITADDHHAHEYARDVSGVVVAWPILADYRRREA